MKVVALGGRVLLAPSLATIAGVRGDGAARVARRAGGFAPDYWIYTAQILPIRLTLIRTCQCACLRGGAGARNPGNEMAGSDRRRGGHHSIERSRS